MEGKIARASRFLLTELGPICSSKSTLKLRGVWLEAKRVMNHSGLQLSRHPALRLKLALMLLHPCAFHAISHLIHASDLVNNLLFAILLVPLNGLHISDDWSKCEILLTSLQLVVFRGLLAAFLEPAFLLSRIEIYVLVSMSHLGLASSLIVQRLGGKCALLHLFILKFLLLG